MGAKWEKKGSEVRSKFRKFAEENTISDDQCHDILLLSRKKWSELVGRDRDASRKVLDVLDGCLSVAEFYAWWGTKLPPVKKKSTAWVVIILLGYC